MEYAISCLQINLWEWEAIRDVVSKAIMKFGADQEYAGNYNRAADRINEIKKAIEILKHYDKA